MTIVEMLSGGVFNEEAHVLQVRSNEEVIFLILLALHHSLRERGGDTAGRRVGDSVHHNQDDQVLQCDVEEAQEGREEPGRSKHRG